jgi:hypothetical protein
VLAVAWLPESLHSAVQQHLLVRAGHMQARKWHKQWSEAGFGCWVTPPSVHVHASEIFRLPAPACPVLSCPAGLLYSSAWYPPGYVTLLDHQLRTSANQLAAQLQLQQQQEEEEEEGQSQEQQQHQHTLREVADQLLLAPRNNG